jgi:hypothetical protein
MICLNWWREGFSFPPSLTFDERSSAYLAESGHPAREDEHKTDDEWKS